MRSFLANPDVAFDPASDILDRLIYGWGNKAYSTEHEFLRAALKSVRDAKGPVLECGSGLSTLLVGAVAAQSGNLVWSLEDHPFWAGRVRQALDEFGIDAVRVDVAPLKRYGDYDWYDPSTDMMPDAFDLVLCDGPPGHTHGGRYGCLPVMRSRLASGCMIIVDDADRDAERQMVEQWSAELGVDFACHGEHKPYFEISIPEPAVDRKSLSV